MIRYDDYGHFPLGQSCWILCRGESIPVCGTKKKMSTETKHSWLGQLIIVNHS